MGRQTKVWFKCLAMWAVDLQFLWDGLLLLTRSQVLKCPKSDVHISNGLLSSVKTIKIATDALGIRKSEDDMVSIVREKLLSSIRSSVGVSWDEKDCFLLVRCRSLKLWGYWYTSSMFDSSDFGRRRTGTDSLRDGHLSQIMRVLWTMVCRRC